MLSESDPGFGLVLSLRFADCPVGLLKLNDGVLEIVADEQA